MNLETQDFSRSGLPSLRVEFFEMLLGVSMAMLCDTYFEMLCDVVLLLPSNGTCSQYLIYGYLEGIVGLESLRGCDVALHDLVVYPYNMPFEDRT